MIVAVELWGIILEKLMCSSSSVCDCRVCCDAVCNSVMCRDGESELLYCKR